MASALICSFRFGRSVAVRLVFLSFGVVVSTSAAYAQDGVAARSKPVPASGKILNAHGKPPLVACRITFWPMDSPKQFVERYKSVPFCISGENGQFAMMLNAKQPGAPPGRYRVTVTAIREEDEKAMAIPKRYRDHEATPWEIVIPAEGRTDILLRIELQ